MKSEGKILQKELAQYLREQDAAQLRLLRAQINAARVERRRALGAARGQCVTARAELRDKQKGERDQFVIRQRGERIAERAACSSGKLAAKTRGLELEGEARGKLAGARTLQRQVRNADKRNTVIRSTKRERAQEDDDAVRSNLPAELVPVFEAVAKRIKGNAKRTRTEAFLEWAEENPEEILAVQQADADAYLRGLQREQRELGRSVRNARRYKQSPDELKKLLAGVPF